MNDTDKKQKLEQAGGKVAAWLEGLGLPANWAKVGGGIIIGAVCGALATCQSGCSRVTPAQVMEVHELYHELSGEPCIFVVGSSGK